MESKGGKPTFLYDLPSPCTSPRVSTRNTSKIPTPESKKDKNLNLPLEWPHDRQHTSSFFDSSASNACKKRKTKSSQDSVPDSQNEVIPSSLPASEDNAHGHRFSFRIADRREREKKSQGNSTDPRDTAIAMRTLESNIYSNEVKMEKIKEHKSNLLKQIHRLQYLVLNDEADIRFYERTNIQLKTQREELQQRAFDTRYHH